MLPGAEDEQQRKFTAAIVENRNLPDSKKMALKMLNGGLWIYGSKFESGIICPNGAELLQEWKDTKVVDIEKFYTDNITAGVKIQVGGSSFIGFSI